MSSRSILTVALLALLVASCGGEPAHRAQPSNGAARSQSPHKTAADADRAQIRDVIRRWNEAELAGDTDAICALVDPAKLEYLEQIGQPCEALYSGVLTPESERDVRSSTITSIEINGADAVAHTHEVSGTHELRLRRTGGHWRVVGGS
jgi:hypothetical protein